MATSGSTDFNQTRNQIIEQAFRKIGIKTTGRALTNEEVNDASDTLNTMVKSWESAGIYLWKQTEGTLFLVKGQAAYKLDGSTANATEEFSEKTTTSDLTSGATVIPLSDLDGVSVNDYIGIKQDDNTIHWSTVSQLGQDATFTEDFNDSSGLTFDSSKVEIVGGKAQLVRADNPGQTFNQDFSSSTGFTFDSDKTEFSAGVMQQKDTRPTDATFAATYTSSIDGVWGDGTLTGTGVNSPSISSNRLDLTGASPYVDYAGTSNASTATQLGAMKWKFTPDYTTTPSVTNANLICVGNTSNSNSLIRMRHRTNGNIQLLVNDNAASAIISNVNLGIWSPTSGTVYEMELNIDFNTGATRFFIDGVQFGSTQAGTGTRTAGDITTIRVGEQLPTVTGSATQAYYEDLILFDAVQHTANYTPGYTLNETIYVGDLITFPQFSYGGSGTIQAFTAFATTQTGGQQFNINGQYWNGSAWVASDDTLGQMNSVSTINTNIGTLAASDTVDIKSRWTASNNQQDTDDLTVTYTGQSAYPTDNPTVTIDTAIIGEIKGWETFTATTSITGSDNVTYILSDDGGTSYKYWNGSAWVTSDGTFAQSNTAADVNTNISTFPITVSGLMVRLFLHSDSGSTTPSIDNLDIEYNVGTAVVIAAGITSDTASGSKVFIYTTKINRPQRVSSCRLRQTASNTDIVVREISRQTYFDLANKTTEGKPSKYFYDKQLTFGNLYLWSTPSDECDQIKFTFNRSFQDFDSATDDPDFPTEWIKPLVYNLAYELGIEYGVGPERLNFVKPEADQSKAEMEGWDREPTSIYFAPSVDTNINS